MKNNLPLFLLLLSTAVLAGCFEADIEAPRHISLGGDEVYSAEPPPPTQIPAADPNSPYELRRENQQLRARLDYVQNQNRKLAKKYDEQADEMDKIRGEMDKLRLERDRYKRGLGE